MNEDNIKKSILKILEKQLKEHVSQLARFEERKKREKPRHSSYIDPYSWSIYQFNNIMNEPIENEIRQNIEIIGHCSAFIENLEIKKEKSNGDI